MYDILECRKYTSTNHCLFVNLNLASQNKQIVSKLDHQKQLLLSYKIARHHLLFQATVNVYSVFLFSIEQVGKTAPALSFSCETNVRPPKVKHSKFTLNA